MGGDITVRSAEGHGTTFTLQFPLCDSRHPAVPMPPAILHGVRVLLLEPYADSARVIVECCTTAGMTVETAVDLEGLVLAAARQSAQGAGISLLLIADTPAALYLSAVSTELAGRLGRSLPTVLLHYPRRRPSVIADGGGRALKPIIAAQLWDAMAEQLDPTTASAATQQVEAPAPRVSAAAAQVLVAVDDSINAKLNDSQLRKEGCDVTLVEDGEKALAITRHRAFDLAFIDMRMPRMDGLEFVRNHRAEETRGTHLPVMGVTANASEQARGACLRAGTDEFVVEPIDPVVLQELVLRYGLRQEGS
jgi:two-component system sensor histidine kinase RpfC